jgi:hypothetical protein
VKLAEPRDNLKSNECAVLVDFSENYATKYETEIQSVHFGASRKQVTLHTGVYYTADAKRSFCTVSENNRHDPAAIWAHLKPVLTVLKNNTDIDTIHFISDSPSSQYRCVKNLLLMKKLIHSEYGFLNATWNFTESSHGKGPADGVGGFVKRTADGLVNSGHDIADAAALFSSLKDNFAVDMYMICDGDIKEVDDIAPTMDELKEHKLPGIVKVHQIISSSSAAFMHHRILSCFCSSDCKCFHPVKCWEDDRFQPVEGGSSLAVQAKKCGRRQRVQSASPTEHAKKKRGKQLTVQPASPTEHAKKKRGKQLTVQPAFSTEQAKKSDKYSRFRLAECRRPTPVAGRKPLPRQPVWLQLHTKGMLL